MSAEVTRLRLRVAPGAARTELAGRYGDAWKVRVQAAPEGGKANRALVALLAERCGIPRANVSVRAGQGSRDKIVELTGLGAEALERRLGTGAPR